MDRAAHDFDLLERWGRGDSQAGSELLERYFTRLYRFFERKVDDSAEDLVQQTMLACVEGRARIRDGTSFAAYVFRAARFQLYEHYRKRRRQVLDFEQISLVDLGTSPSGVLRVKQDQRFLLEALRRIPLEYQLVLELSLWEDLPSSEVAEVLDIAEPTVRTRLHRAIKRLRNEVGQLAAAPVALLETDDDFAAWSQRLRQVVERDPQRDA